MTITADLVPGSPLHIASRQDVIDRLIAEHAGREKLVKVQEQSAQATQATERIIDPRDWRTLPENTFEKQRDRWTDEEVIEKATHAKNGEQFKALFERGSLVQFGGDQNRADLQLVKYLLYWTNGNQEQTNRLFERSALMRPKWRDRKNAGGGGHSYGEVTIYKVVKYNERKLTEQ